MSDSGSGPAGSEDPAEPAAEGRPPRPVSSRHLGLRLVQLYAGLLLYGASIGLLVRAELGLPPWDVLHQGLSRLTGLSIGTASLVLGVVVLLLWLPMRQRPGFGTVSNALLVGPAADATIWLTPAPHSLGLQIPLVVLGVVLNGVATGLYISARFGAGPRDGLMTGLHRVTNRSVRLVRTAIEATVLVSGLLLGGTAGVGTVVYALAIGPLSQLFLRVFTVQRDGPEVSGSHPEKGPGKQPEGRGGTRVVARGCCSDAAAGGAPVPEPEVPEPDVPEPEGGRRRPWWRRGAILRR